MHRHRAGTIFMPSNCYPEHLSHFTRFPSNNRHHYTLRRLPCANSVAPTHYYYLPRSPGNNQGCTAASVQSLSRLVPFHDSHPSFAPLTAGVKAKNRLYSCNATTTGPRMGFPMASGWQRGTESSSHRTSYIHLNNRTQEGSSLAGLMRPSGGPALPKEEVQQAVPLLIEAANSTHEA